MRSVGFVPRLLRSSSASAATAPRRLAFATTAFSPMRSVGFVPRLLRSSSASAATAPRLLAFATTAFSPMRSVGFVGRLLRLLNNRSGVSFLNSSASSVRCDRLLAALAHYLHSGQAVPELRCTPISSNQPSPSNVMDTTVKVIKAPGTKTAHQFPCTRLS